MTGLALKRMARCRPAAGTHSSGQGTGGEGGTPPGSDGAGIETGKTGGGGDGGIETGKTRGGGDGGCEVATRSVLLAPAPPTGLRKLHALSVRQSTKMPDVYSTESQAPSPMHVSLQSDGDSQMYLIDTHALSP